MTDESETPTATGESVAKIATACSKCGASVEVLNLFDEGKMKDLLLKCGGCGQKYRGHVENSVLVLDGFEDDEKPAESAPAPVQKADAKPKEKQVKSVEIVDHYGKSEKVHGISYFEETAGRVNVAGHFEEEVEVEKEKGGRKVMAKEIKRTPATISVPRSAIIEVKKEYHQQ